MVWPFENNTKKVEKRLAKRSLEADRGRNLVAVFTIGLAVCLMASVAFIYSAMHESTVARLRGQYQSGCSELSYEDIERLAASGRFESWGYEGDGGNIRYADTSITVHFYDEGMRELMRVEPITGAYPKKENEICVERGMLRYLNMPEETGQSFRLDMGDGEQEYIISGILEKENTSRQYDLYISEALAAKGGEKPFTIRFRMKGGDMEQPEHLRTEIKLFYEEMGIPERVTFYSSTYFDLNDIYLGSDMPVYGVALLIAVVCAVVIYNIFYISVMGKLREYGRLKVIGTTPRQLRRVVKYERRALMCVGIPAGMIGAALLVTVLYPGYWNWTRNLQYAAFIIAITVIMVMAATRKPLQLTGKVSAIEAVRSNAYQAVSERHFRTGKPSQTLSVFRLACMNFTRNKRKTALTLISLGLTGVLTACISSYAASVDVEELCRSGFGDGGDYIVDVEDYSTSPVVQRDGLLNRQMREKMLDLPGVDYVTSWSRVDCKVAQSPDEESIYIVGGYTREQMEGYGENDEILEGDADYDALLENDGILVTRDGENLLEKLYHLKLSMGDTVTLQSMEGVSKDYTVMGIVDYRKGSGTYASFVLPEEELGTLYPGIEDFTSFVNIHVTQASDEQRQALYKLVDDPRAVIMALTDMMELTETSLRNTLLLMYGMVGFIGLFALVNLINTLMTNLLTRQQEFGIFQAVGMTDGQLSRMISTECLCYMGVTVLFTISIGTLCGMGTVQLFKKMDLFGKLTYHFPAAAMLIFAGVLFAVYLLFIPVAIRFLHRQTVIERIKVID